jgi:hypothetical protein
MAVIYCNNQVQHQQQKQTPQKYPVSNNIPHSNSTDCQQQQWLHQQSTMDHGWTTFLQLFHDAEKDLRL